MEVKNQFTITKNLFKEYTNYTTPLSYDEWLDVADSLKAGVLFVQFFDQITLAWNKAKSFYVLEEDGVSTMMQYLIKNTPIIAADPKKFNPRYIYRVAYNCLYCVSRDIKRDRDAYENNVPQYTVVGDQELDLFDTVIRNEDFLLEIDRNEFWKLVDSLSDDAKKLLTDILKRDISSMKLSKKRQSIMEELKSMFKSYRYKFGLDHEESITFEDIINIDDEVESAIVVMPDGQLAVYYGDTGIDVEFFGSDRDYTIPLSLAKNLKVLEISKY